MFDGQSLLVSPVLGLSPPYKIMEGLSVPYVVAAIAGTTFAQREVSVASRVDALLKSYAGDKPTIYVNLGGYSDIVGGMTGAVAADAAIANASQRRLSGFEYIVEFTQPHNTIMTAPQHTQRLIYNEALLESEVFDSVIDLTLDAELNDATDVAYYSDGLHFTQAGADLVASISRPIITGFL